jgi:RAD51-like protein 3
MYISGRYLGRYKLIIPFLWISRLLHTHIQINFLIMRLSNLVPSLPASLVASLEANGIRTEVDLLFSAPTFDIFRRLPAGTVTLQELIDYTSLAAELCAAPGVSAHEVFMNEEAASATDVELRSGNLELDTLLQGLGRRKVIEVSGDRGSGKSVCFLRALAVLFSLYDNALST